MKRTGDGRTPNVAGAVTGDVPSVLMDSEMTTGNGAAAVRNAGDMMIAVPSVARSAANAMVLDAMIVGSPAIRTVGAGAKEMASGVRGRVRMTVASKDVLAVRTQPDAVGPVAMTVPRVSGLARGTRGAVGLKATVAVVRASRVVSALAGIAGKAMAETVPDTRGGVLTIGGVLVAPVTIDGAIGVTRETKGTEAGPSNAAMVMIVVGNRPISAVRKSLAGVSKAVMIAVLAATPTRVATIGRSRLGVAMTTGALEAHSTAETMTSVGGRSIVGMATAASVVGRISVEMAKSAVMAVRSVDKVATVVVPSKAVEAINEAGRSSVAMTNVVQDALIAVATTGAHEMTTGAPVEMTGGAARVRSRDAMSAAIGQVAVNARGAVLAVRVPIGKAKSSFRMCLAQVWNASQMNLIHQPT